MLRLGRRSQTASSGGKDRRGRSEPSRGVSAQSAVHLRRYGGNLDSQGGVAFSTGDSLVDMFFVWSSVHQPL